MNSPKLTVIDAIASLGFRKWITDHGTARHELFSWPPDVFAMAATILKESGAYLQAARCHDYEQAGEVNFDLRKWPEYIEKHAEEWRRTRPGVDAPEEVQKLLDQVAADALGKGTPLLLHALSQPDRGNLTWLPYMKLMCIADHACRGVGLIFPPTATFSGKRTTSSAALKRLVKNYPQDSAVCTAAMVHLMDQGMNQSTPQDLHAFRPITLCKVVDPSRAIVLPKMRTSQRGVTIRSFSLHLSLLNGTDVEPRWYGTPDVMLLENASRNKRTKIDRSHPDGIGYDEIAQEAGPYNIVLLPWPFDIRPSQFVPVGKSLKTLGGRPPTHHQFFGFKHDPLPATFRQRVADLLVRASERVGPIHGLVLPEMAMTLRDFESVFGNDLMGKLSFLACGVYEPATKSGELSKNYVIIQRRAGQPNSVLTHRQDKHHRWALDRSQINAYSLGSVLRDTCTWWEGIDLPRRQLNVFALDSFTAFSVLVCEDLARPDPVGDAVRAIGPNLVICLLMDGPQLNTRWGAKYATVLADDPGSSVLTLSSLGMVNISRTRDKLHESSRVVALWREPGNSPVELTLPQGKHALVLSLSAQGGTEYTVDGRHDSGMAGTIKLAGAHPIAWGSDD